MDFFRFRFCTWVCRKAGNVWNPQLKASVVKCVCCAIWWDVITWIDVVCSMYCNYIIDHRLTDVIMISYQNFSEKKSSFNKTVQPMRLTTTSEARNRRTDWPLYFTAEDPAPISVGTHRADRRSGWMIATSIQCSNRYMCWDQRFQKNGSLQMSDVMMFHSPSLMRLGFAISLENCSQFLCCWACILVV